VKDRQAESPKRHTTAAAITTGVVALVVAVHMFFTLTYNVPYPAVRNDVLPGAAAAEYMEPLFVQDYRIFAPNPAGDDRRLFVRAWIEQPDGEMETTEWVDVTAVELSDGYRKLLRKQLSIVGAERLMPAYRALSPEQQEIADKNYHRTGFDRLRADLIEADPDGSVSTVDAFIRASEYVTAYGTQVAYALWGDEGEIMGIHTRVVYDPVIRWNDRNDPDAKRPAPVSINPGWRSPLEYEGQDREKFGEVFRSWAEGVTGR